MTTNFGIDEAGQRANAPGLQTTTDIPDCPANAAGQQAHQAHKRIPTCIARAALAGVVVAVVDGDDGQPLFVANRWAMTRAFTGIDELETWLVRMAGVK